MGIPIVIAGNAAREAAESTKGKKFSIWDTLGGVGKGILDTLGGGGVDEIQAEPLLQTDSRSANTALYFFAFALVAALVAVFFIAQRK